ncbi:hypothetical protein EV426DRAFT_596394 [Tirmania nivea]|nr:hypothetical protein EV426DRAFT_596394 [Tirmania nivea]
MDRFQNLDDIQLAVLLSLIAKRHCLVTTDEQHLDPLQKQLEKVGSAGFGLSTAIVTCTPETTIDDFVAAILLQEENKSPQRPSHSPVMSFDSRESYFSRRHRHQLSGGTVDDLWRGRRIANFVIARNLDLAPEQVQIQALELLRSKRITRKEVHQAPARFLMVALLAKVPVGSPLNCHLVDQFFISHYHDPEDNAEDEDPEADSASSVIIRKPRSRLPSFMGSSGQKLLFSNQELDNLSALADDAHVSTEIKRYMMDIVVFLRMHRAVAGGISAKATKDFEYLVKCLCPVNGLRFANPSIVALAAYKVYGHRIVVADKDMDRSVMWGSKKEAVDKYLAEVDAGMIISNVLDEVRAPL